MVMIPVVITDDNGAIDVTMLSITVTGTNDVPVAALETVTVNEDAAVIHGSGPI